MKYWAIPVLLGLVLLAARSRGADAMNNLYVATDGDDRNVGTKEAPFATLERARDAIRAMKKGGGLPGGGVAVLLRGGTYELAKSFTLSAEDSGAADARIEYRPVKGETVRLIGGKDLPPSAARAVTDDAVLRRLDEPARPHVRQIDLKALGISDFGRMPRRGFGKSHNPAAPELFFNDRPMTLARWPNEGFVETGKILDSGPPFVPPGETARPVDLSKLGGRFLFPNDRIKRWADADDLWVHGYWCWDWANEYLPVKSVDPANHEITLAAAHSYGLKQGKRFYVLNLLEELDRPGEWYLERKTGLLYFWPPAPIEKARITLSLLPDPLIFLNGASHVTLRGLTIEAGRAAGVRIEDGSNDLIAGCTLRNLGTWAVQIGHGFEYGNTVAPTHGGESNGVRSCNIHDTGGGGIVLSGGDRKTLKPAGNFAVNNDIHDYGRIDRTYCPAVDVSGVGNRVANNHIHDAPHIGVLFWGNDHVLELNHVHHLCQETADAGAFYTGRDWSMRGNVIRRNFIHDIGRYAAAKEFGGTMAVYLDDFASGTAVTGNIVANVYIGVMIGGGHDNVVENNIWANCSHAAIHVDARGLGWAKKCMDGSDPIMFNRLKAVNYKEPPYAARYPELVRVLDGNPGEPKGNRVVRNVCSADRWTALHDGMTEKKAGFADNLVLPDAGFVNPAKGDYRLRDDSTVFKQLPGFEKIPFEKIGPQPE